MESSLIGKALLIGSGALARDIVNVAGRECFAGTYVDPGFAADPVEGLPVFTSWAEARMVTSQYIIGVLDRNHRLKARQAALEAGFYPAPPLIHATAQVAGSARLAPGCVVGYFSVIGPGAELCEDVMVMFSAIVSHDAYIGENSVILHGACVGGYCRVGQGCFVGANSVLSPKITIGDDSFVAAGASCFKSAPECSMLLGNPARISAQTR